jgi:hypothetical protein
VVLVVEAVTQEAAVLGQAVKEMLVVRGHLIRAVGVKLGVAVGALLLWVAMEQTLVLHQHQKAEMAAQELRG